MKNPLLLLCTHNEYTVVLKVVDGFAMKNLVDEVCKRWSDLIRDSFYFTYSLPGHPNVILGDQYDLENLVSLAPCFSLGHVDIRIKKQDNAKSGFISISDNAYRETPLSTNSRGKKNDNAESSIVPLEYNNNNTTHGDAPLSTHSRGKREAEKFDIAEIGIPRLDDTDYKTPLITCSREEDLLPMTPFSPDESTSLSAVWGEGIREVGQAFKGGAAHFRDVLIKYAIEVGFDFKYVKNDTMRVTAVCSGKESKGCQWNVHARVDLCNNYFYIRRLENVHTCGAVCRTRKSPKMNSNVVAGVVVNEIRIKPTMRPIDVIDEFRSKYGLDISYNHAWLGVEKARNGLFGDQSLAYDQLRWYVDACLETNPGSRLELEYDQETRRFKRLFVSFAACIHGFNSCRPILFLDGTFLNSRYRGTFLSAIGKDGNQDMYPFAFAVVDYDSEENWSWFLEQLHHVVSPDRPITFISDCNTGVFNALKKVFPQSHHSFCFEHLKENLIDKLSGRGDTVKQRLIFKFGQCFNSPTPEPFDEYMEELIAEGGQKVEDFIKEINPGNWSNAFFKGQRYGEASLKVDEEFNGWISDARHLPIHGLVDKVRIGLMGRMFLRSQQYLDTTRILCPVMDEKLSKNLDEGRGWAVGLAGPVNGVFEVHSYPSVLVNIEARTCSCFEWQINGFPCAHACAAIEKQGMDLNNFIDGYYHISSYRESYSKSIHPVPTWGKPDPKVEDVVILPPLAKRSRGRPRKDMVTLRGEKMKQNSV